MNKKLTIITICFSILLIAIFALVRKVPKLVELTTFEKAHNYVSLSNEEKIDIGIFIDHKNSFITNIENISSCYIGDDDNILNLKIENIIQSNQITKLKNKDFYLFNFLFSPKLILESDFSFEVFNASLIINYTQGEDIKIRIGSFSYYYFSNNNNEHLSINKLKGLVNEIENQTLVGVGLGLKNNSSSSLVIKQIIPLDVNLEISYENIKDNITFNNNDLIEEVLGYNYNIYNNNIDFSEINKVINNEVYLFLPLKYKNKLIVNNLGLLVIYELNEEEYKLYIDDFVFFKTKLYSINTINNLKYYVYENN